ncbi:MAG: metallophosphoesterase [Bacteroidales bacterium]|jgi:predicted MPP superfamily phosphohydrolase|nr:metallophosphoesterase [Bacteroidales bacterium]
MFFIIALLIYLIANAYVIIRALAVIPTGFAALKTCFAVILILLALSFIVSMLPQTEKICPQCLKILQPIGSTWLFSLLYIVPTLILIDIIRILNRYLHFLPFLNTHSQAAGLITAAAIVVSLICIFALGYAKFNKPSVVELKIHSNKDTARFPRILAASDLHFGYILSAKRAEEFVNIINEQRPDVVLLCGDIFDRSLKPVEAANIPAILRKINAPLGTYAVFGNHEYYGNPSRAAQLLKDAGITLLRDSVVKITDDICLVGRDDKTNPQRQNLARLTADVDKSNFIIVLDHQPSNLHEAQTSQADLQLSGHTHDGQIFPINLLTRRLYEQSYGYYCKGLTQYYITSGLGLWGSPYRIGTRSEVVLITKQ